jgi:hypothetical protein
MFERYPLPSACLTPLSPRAHPFRTFESVFHCLRHKEFCESKESGRCAVKIVARTGYGETARVFDPGRRDERISETPWRSLRRGELVRVTEIETGPLLQRQPEED